MKELQEEIKKLKAQTNATQTLEKAQEAKVAEEKKEVARLTVALAKSK